MRGLTKFNFELNLKVSAFYLEKQKSFVPKKIKLSRCQYQNKKAFFTVSIFPKVLRKMKNEKERIMFYLHSHRTTFLHRYSFTNIVCNFFGYSFLNCFTDFFFYHLTNSGWYRACITGCFISWQFI